MTKGGFSPPTLGGGRDKLLLMPNNKQPGLKQVPPEVSAELSTSVQKLRMNGENGSPSQHDLVGMRDRVSGLDSYMGSSDISPTAGNGTNGTGPRTLQEKIQMTKAQHAQEKRLGLKAVSPVKEINKQKRVRKASVAGIAATIKELQGERMTTDGIRIEAGGADVAEEATDEVSTEQNKQADGQLGNLTGTR